MIESEEMKKRMNKKYFEFLFERMSIFLWLHDDFCFRKYHFSCNFCFFYFWKIIKIMKWKHIGSPFFSSIRSIQEGNLFIKKKCYVYNPLLWNRNFRSYFFKNFWNPQPIYRKTLWWMYNRIGKHKRRVIVYLWEFSLPHEDEYHASHILFLVHNLGERGYPATIIFHHWWKNSHVFHLHELNRFSFISVSYHRWVFQHWVFRYVHVLR